MSTLSFRLFGFPRLSVNGSAVEFPLKKGLALLIYLSESRNPVSRDDAAALLWPEANENTARARLRRTLHRLRSLLDTEAIHADRDMLQISARVNIDSDAEAFERECESGNFRRAIELYRADFLAGFSVRGSEELEEWLFFRREALRGKLLQALERLYQQQCGDSDYAAAVATATTLVDLNPLNETAHGYLIKAHLNNGDRSAAQYQFEACARILSAELGVRPCAELEVLLYPPLEPDDLDVYPTQYTENEGVHLAYQIVGGGPVDIVLVSGFVYVSHVERVWEEPRCRDFLHSLSQMGRLIIFDRRGIGLSERVGVRLDTASTASDIRAVMDAAGSQKAVLVGLSEGGPGCVHFAANLPDRLLGLALYGSQARGCWAEDYPHAPKRRQYDAWLSQLVDHWGTHTQIDKFAPSLVGDRKTESWWAGLLRAASSPAAIKGVLESFRDADVRALLPAVFTPTLVMHRRGDRAVQPAAGLDLAKAIGAARFVELEGSDHWFFAGNQNHILDEIRRFIATVGN